MHWKYCTSIEISLTTFFISWFSTNTREFNNITAYNWKLYYIPFLKSAVYTSTHFEICMFSWYTFFWVMPIRFFHFHPKNWRSEKTNIYCNRWKMLGWYSYLRHSRSCWRHMICGLSCACAICDAGQPQCFIDIHVLQCTMYIHRIQLAVIFRW